MIATGTSGGGLLARPAERAVAVGFRAQLAGYETCDVHCWELAWTTYEQLVGTRAAKSLFAELHGWVRAIRFGAARTIAVYPPCCRWLSPDECMALSAVTACQYQDRQAAEYAGKILLGCEEIGAMLDAAQDFAGALADSGLRLLPVGLDVIASIAAGRQSQLQ